MNTLTEQQQSLVRVFWKIVDFIEAHRGKECLQDCDRTKLFRYVAHSYFTGKLCVSWEEGKIVAVAFYWPDFKENIEACFVENLSQFKWQPTHKGDALFVGNVIGNRKAIARMWAATIERFPHMITTPIFTYRKKKLVQITNEQLERFLKEDK
jgi:hypothetical protein